MQSKWQQPKAEVNAGETSRKPVAHRITAAGITQAHVPVHNARKRGRILSGLGWILLAVTILICLAVVFQVDRLPQLSLFSYIPLYPFILLPITGVVLARPWRLGIPSAAILVFSLLYFDGFGIALGRAFVTKGKDNTIRIISYNIEDWHGPNKQGFYDLINNKKPDLLALQEAWGPGDLQDHRCDPIRTFAWGKTDGRHVGLSSEFTPLLYEKLDEYGNAVFVDYHGKRFWIASVQFPRGIDSARSMQFLPTKARLEQGRYARFLARWLDDKEDVLVVGDFNSVAHSWFIRSLHLRNCWRTTGLGIGGTYKVDLPVARIDHVLVKGRILPVYSETLYIPGFSNHRGILLDFNIDEIPSYSGNDNRIKDKS